MNKYRPIFEGSNGESYTWDEIDAWEGKCPDCEGEMDHGTWIPTMTSDYQCEDEECGFCISYPANRPDDIELP